MSGFFPYSFASNPLPIPHSNDNMQTRAHNHFTMSWNTEKSPFWQYISLLDNVPNYLVWCVIQKRIVLLFACMLNIGLKGKQFFCSKMDFFFLCFISLCIFLDLLKDVLLGFLAIFIRGKMQSLENDPIMPIWYRQYFAISISFPSILNTYYECRIWKRNYNSTDVKYLINCQVQNNCIYFSFG